MTEVEPLSVTKARPPRGPIAILDGAEASTTVPTIPRLAVLTIETLPLILGDEERSFRRERSRCHRVWPPPGIGGSKTVFVAMSDH